MIEYYIDDSSGILANNLFTTDLGDWIDATGSWTWVSGGGVEYDNDGERNPLSQSVFLPVGWYKLDLTPSGGWTGEVRAIITQDSNQGTIFDQLPDADKYFYCTEEADYTVSLYADDFTGFIENVWLVSAIFRPPLPDIPDIQVSETELLSNPNFANDLGGWNDITSSWTWATGHGAQYDNDGEHNPLVQEVVLTDDWYRLSVQLAPGTTMDDMLVEVAGITATQIEVEYSERSAYFQGWDDTFEIRIFVTNLTGNVSQVSLAKVVFNPKPTWVRPARIVETTGPTYNVGIADTHILVDTTSNAVYVKMYVSTNFDGITHYIQNEQGINNLDVEIVSDVITLSGAGEGVRLFAYSGIWFVE